MMGMSRRSLMGSAIALGSTALMLPGLNRARGGVINDKMTGDLTPTHDPCMIKQGDTYYVFSTGPSGSDTGLIPWRTSKDLMNWTRRGSVFQTIPKWALDAIPGTRGIWAPDVSYFNGQYRLYYAVSTFGSNHS